MATANISVAFHTEAPLGLFGLYMQTIDTPDGTFRYLNCKTAEMDTNGFMRLVPADIDQPGGPIALFVHPSYIAWMLQADKARVLGFLAGQQKA